MSERTDEMNPNSDQAALADALRTLAPASTGINRDRLLYDAGRSAAAPRRSWLWAAGTLLFAAAAIALAGFVVFADRPAQTIVVERERIVEVRVPVSAEAPAQASPALHPNEVKHEDDSLSPETVRMYQVRRDVLRWGVAMLPPSKLAERTTAFRGDSTRDLERWLDIPVGTLTASPAKRSGFFPTMQGDN